MTTKDKVTEIFCLADDLCKFFDAIMAKHTQNPTKKRKYHRDSAIPMAEIILIVVLFHDSGYHSFKHFYLEKVGKHLRHLFPKVVSYNRFTELQREVAILLALFVLKGFWANVRGTALLTVRFFILVLITRCGYLSNQILSSRYSAICTAFSAAPLRIWSPVSQSVALLSSARSFLMRPTNTSSCPALSKGMG